MIMRIMLFWPMIELINALLLRILVAKGLIGKVICSFA
ncbi:hypothetical protein SynROS8604_00133 [Synechococcus sp. ROS8604]|nr:hypothetical protein SynROS8604_00133 [Synechococcus sp. ROS8604]